MAGRIAGAKDTTIIARHLLPGILSYIIVALTLAVPEMILAETALSFSRARIATTGSQLGSVVK